MTQQEFINSKKRVTENRVHKITNSFGVYDYFKYYRKNKPKEKKFVLTEKEYYKIIREVNNELIEVLFNEGQLKLPCEFGLIILEKFDISPKIDSKGNLVYKAPIDWNETLKLWHEDEEALNNKIKIKKEIKYAYKINYKKNKAKYKNKTFYNIKFNRELKILLNKRDKENKVNILFNNKKSVIK